MHGRNVSSAVGGSTIRLAWKRGVRLERVRHPRLGEVVLVSITFMLVGVLLATVQHALEASPMPMGWAFGIGLH